MEEEIKFAFTAQEVDIITNALAHRPYGEVHNIMTKILQTMNPPPTRGISLDGCGELGD